MIRGRLREKPCLKGEPVTSHRSLGRAFTIAILISWFSPKRHGQPWRVKHQRQGWRSGPVSGMKSRGVKPRSTSQFDASVGVNLSP